MIENIRKEFKVMLDENKWMDAQSKAAAKEKVNKAKC
jgi:predicted metalloendopeptidase